MHRVVGITSKGLITQGDNRLTNPNPDEPNEWPPVPANCVKGVVLVAVPYLGLVSMVIPYPWNYAIVGLILVFVFITELRPSTEREIGDDDTGRTVGTTGVPNEGGPARPQAESQNPDTSRT